MHYNSNNHIPLIYLRFKNLKHQSTNSCTQPHIYIPLIYSKFKNLKHQSTNNSINWLYTTSNSSIQSKHYIISQPTYIFNPFHRFKKRKKYNNIKALLTSTQSWVAENQASKPHQCGKMEQHVCNLFLHRIYSLTHDHYMCDSPQKFSHGDLTERISTHPYILHAFTIKKM